MGYASLVSSPVLVMQVPQHLHENHVSPSSLGAVAHGHTVVSTDMPAHRGRGRSPVFCFPQTGPRLIHPGGQMEVLRIDGIGLGANRVRYGSCNTSSCLVREQGLQVDGMGVFHPSDAAFEDLEIACGVWILGR
ncbi:hypothetical protein PMIN06_008229 [Paraphaeosphaeria minitans]